MAILTPLFAIDAVVQNKLWTSLTTNISKAAFSRTFEIMGELIKITLSYYLRALVQMLLHRCYVNGSSRNRCDELQRV